MDSIDQIPSFTLLGERQIAARVEYKVCNQCGFRLMRVETTIINDQQLKVQYCPICEQFSNEHQEQTKQLKARKASVDAHEAVKERAYNEILDKIGSHKRAIEKNVYGSLGIRVQIL